MRWLAILVLGACVAYLIFLGPAAQAPHSPKSSPPPPPASAASTASAAPAASASPRRSGNVFKDPIDRARKAVEATRERSKDAF